MGGKVVWVLGGGSGIGQGIALRCAAQGAAVFVSGRRPEALESTVARGLPGAVTALPCDAAEPAQAQAAAETIVRAHGRLDALAISVGSALAGGLATTSLEDWRAMTRSHLDAMFLGCQAALPGLLRGQGAAILVLGSIFGLRGKANRLAYCTVKGAVSNFVRSLALELAPQVRVNALCPGWVETDMSLSLVRAAADPEAALAERQAWHPMGRGGTVDETADMAAFLLSDRAAWMTGQNVALDGGYTAA